MLGTRSLNSSYFTGEALAIAKLEAVLWPHGPVCPHCGALRAGRVTGRGARVGLWFCLVCRKQFRVTIGTIFEHSHVPVHLWLAALALLLYAEDMNAHRLHQVIGITYKTALRMVAAIDDALGTDFEIRTFDDAIRGVAARRANEPARSAEPATPQSRP